MDEDAGDEEEAKEMKIGQSLKKILKSISVLNQKTLN